MKRKITGGLLSVLPCFANFWVNKYEMKVKTDNFQFSLALSSVKVIFNIFCLISRYIDISHQIPDKIEIFRKSILNIKSIKPRFTFTHHHPRDP